MGEKIWLKNYDPGVPHTLKLPEVNCHYLLEERTRLTPNEVAVTIMGMPTTYAELNARANRFARALLDKGLKRGERVAIIMGNSPSYVSCQFGILKAGGVAVPINPLYTGREMSHVLTDSEAQAAVVLSLFADNVNQVKDKTSLDKIIVVPIPGMEVPLPDGAVSLEDFTAGFSEDNLDLDISPSETALVLYTGGTTGRSKGAALHHRSQVYASYVLASLDPSMEAHKDSFVLVNPLFHIMGNVIMTFCLHAGLPVHLVPQYDPGLVLKTIDDMKPTWFPGVPTMFIGIMNHPEVHKYDLTSIKYCVSGAAPFAVESLEKFEAITKCRVIEVFGLTESGAAIFFNPFVNPRKIGSIGIPTADMDAKIVDLENDQEEKGINDIGELLVAGPPIMKHYLNIPEETEDALNGGWLHTGDIAKMDEDGFFWIVDRKKDLIVAGGFNIYPRDVEEVLYEHPDVVLACAIGVPDPYRGETVKAFIVPAPGKVLTEEEIIAFCRQKLAAYKVPKLIEFREALPTSIIGKVLRKTLREEERKKRESDQQA